MMDGIHKAVEQNFERVKINCVVMRGLNDDELVNFIKLAKDMVRFLLPILHSKFCQLLCMSVHWFDGTTTAFACVYLVPHHRKNKRISRVALPQAMSVQLYCNVSI